MLDYKDFACTQGARDVDFWFEDVKKSASNMGCTRISLCIMRNLNASPLDIYIISNYSEKWRALYANKKYSLIDPILKYSRDNIAPIIWHNSPCKNQAQRDFMKNANLHGFNSDIAFPLHAPLGQFGYLSLGLDKDSGDSKSCHITSGKEGLYFLRDAVFQSLLDLKFIEKIFIQPSLTVREREILKWYALGKTAWEISMICACSAATINFHLKNIRTKLGVSTSGMAVTRAILLRIIEV